MPGQIETGFEDNSASRILTSDAGSYITGIAINVDGNRAHVAVQAAENLICQLSKISCADADDNFVDPG